MKIIKLIITNIIVPIVIILIGVMVFKSMVGNKKGVKKVKVVDKNFPIVKTTNFSPIDQKIEIVEYGNVVMPDIVEVVPRVMGNITKISNKLFDGNFVKKGDVLVVIDQSDYKLAIKMAEAEVSRNKFNLIREEEEGKIAKAEWDLYKKRYKDATPSKLRLRIPQIETAKAALKAAEANLSKAKLSLSRTIIRAPFDAKVVKKYLSKGQFVGVGSKIAKLQSVEKAYIKLYLKDSDLKLIPDIFTIDNKLVGVEANFAGRVIKKEGKIISIGSTLDRATKMLEVTIEVEKPYKDSKNPLIEGMYVKLTLPGRELTNIFKVKEGLIYRDSIFVYNNGMLNIKKIDIISLKDGFYLIKGISKDDKIITTSINEPINGMRLELESHKKDKQKKKKNLKVTPKKKESVSLDISDFTFVNEVKSEFLTTKFNNFKNQKSSMKRVSILKEFTFVNDVKSEFLTTKFMKIKNQKSSRKRVSILKEFTFVNDVKSEFLTTKFEDFGSC